MSVTSNIAEGFGRISEKERIQFYYLSLGSLTEIQNQLLIAKDLNYIKNNEFQILVDQTIEVSKLLKALLKSIKKPPQTTLS